MTSKTLLGLDVSTSIIGYTILDYSTGKHISSGYVEFDKKTSLVARAYTFSYKIKKIASEYNIGSVWIEEPFMMFAKGGSSAQTMSRLSTFNGMIQYMCYKAFLSEPNMINANHARKTLEMNMQREKVCGVTTKNQVLKWVKNELPDYVWPMKTLKSGPRKGLSIEKPGCYDIADSFVVAKSGFVKSQL